MVQSSHSNPYSILLLKSNEYQHYANLSALDSEYLHIAEVGL